MRYVFRSDDAGATWLSSRLLADVPEPIAIVMPRRWLRFSYPTPQETTDAGATWHVYSTDYRQGAAPVAPPLVFADGSVGYATVPFSLQRTLDGGEHWSGLRIPARDESIRQGCPRCR